MKPEQLHQLRVHEVLDTKLFHRLRPETVLALPVKQLLPQLV